MDQFFDAKNRPDIDQAQIHETAPKNYDGDIPLEDGVQKEVILGKYSVAAGKDTGKERSLNADNFNVSRISVDIPQDASSAEAGTRIAENLILTADGAGEGPEADTASRIAVNITKTEYSRLRGTGMDAKDALEQAVAAANKAVFAYKTRSNVRTSASFAGVVLKDDGTFDSAKVGTARIYTVDDQNALPIGLDHSIGAVKIERGLTTEEEAVRSGEYKNPTRAIGEREDVAIDINSGKLHSNEKVLLCTKALWAATPGDNGENIRDIVASSASQTEAVQRLIDSTNDLSGDDNVAVVLAAFDPPVVRGAVKPEAAAHVTGEHQGIYNYGDKVRVAPNGPLDWQVVGYGFDKVRNITTIKVRKSKHGKIVDGMAADETKVPPDQVLSFTPQELTALNKQQSHVNDELTVISPPLPKSAEQAVAPAPYFSGSKDFDNLYGMLKQRGGITTSPRSGGVFLDAEEVERRTRGVLRGEYPIHSLPSGDGYRAEVQRLLRIAVEKAEEEQPLIQDKKEDNPAGRLARIRALLRGK